MRSLRQRFLATIPFVVLLAVAYVGCSSDDKGTDPPPPQKGSIAVISTPTGALIYLDGDSTGNVTNDTLSNLDPGDYTVLLVLDDYLEWDSTVTVTANAMTNVSVVLQQEFSLDIDIEGFGRVIKNPDKSLYSGGEQVELTPIPGVFWLFDGWSGDFISSDSVVTVTMDDDMEINATFGLSPTPPTVARVHGTIRRDDGLDLVKPVVFLDSSHTEIIVIVDGLGWLGDPATGEIAIQYNMDDLDSVHAIITGWDDLNENDTIEVGAGEPIGWWDWDGDDYWDNSHVWLRKGETITDADVVIFIMTAAATRRFSQPTGVRIESIK